MLAGEHSRGCVKPSASDWCVLCELEKLAVQAYGADDGSSGSGKVLNPRPLVSACHAWDRQPGTRAEVANGRHITRGHWRALF